MIIVNRILLNPLLQQPPPSMSSIIAINSPSLCYRNHRLSLQFRYVNGGDLFLCRRRRRKCRSRIRVYCESSKTEEKQVRKYSPLLESPLVSENNVSTAEFKTIPDIWRSSAEKFGDRVALVDPHHDPPTNMTYKQDNIKFSEMGGGLRVIGIKPTEKIALFADNSCRWLIADQGAINVVIDLASVRFAILLWGEKSSISSHTMEEIPAYSYKEIIDTGHEHRANLADSHDAREKYVFEPIQRLTTLAALKTQVQNFGDIVPAGPGDRFLSMLPPWHAYERACEYFILSSGTKQVYTTVKHLKDDLRYYQPHGIQKQISTSSAIRKLVAVSLIRISMAYMQFKNIYEGKCLSRTQKQPSYIAAMLDWLYARVIAAILLPLHVLATKIVYSKIHSSIGLSKAGICGGGSLPTHVDKFYEAIGTKVQVGYGLTEASPVVAARLPDCNVLGSVGPPIRHTEVKVVHDETGDDLPPGSKGIVKVRGPQIMQGYYKVAQITWFWHCV
ncbi:probable acyl-activating enzyme 16, chloroplastic [Tanacetum coccineum]